MPRRQGGERKQDSSTSCLRCPSRERAQLAVNDARSFPFVKSPTLKQGGQLQGGSDTVAQAGVSDWARLLSQFGPDAAFFCINGSVLVQKLRRQSASLAGACPTAAAAAKARADRQAVHIGTWVEHAGRALIIARDADNAAQGLLPDVEVILQRAALAGAALRATLLQRRAAVAQSDAVKSREALVAKVRDESQSLPAQITLVNLETHRSPVRTRPAAAAALVSDGSSSEEEEEGEEEGENVEPPAKRLCCGRRQGAAVARAGRR